MRIAVFFWLCLALTARAEDARTLAFTVPWGAGTGAVGREAASSANAYQGPASVRAGRDGEILVADTVNHRILRFTPAGQLAATAEFPAQTKGDARIEGVDVAQDRAGDLWVLELAMRALVHLGADGALKGRLPIPVAPGATPLFTEVATEDDGFLVFDGFDNRVLKLARDGKATVVTHELIAGLATDSGAPLAVELASPTSAAGFTLWQLNAGQKTLRAALTLERPANELRLLGVDREHRAYVEVAYGGELTRADRQVLVVSADGKVTDRMQVPVPPTEFRMHVSRCVIPAGGLLTASVTPAGLEIRTHRLSSR